MGTYRFPPFDFDSEALRLRKRGVRTKLQRKPALLLAALLEQAGQVLTRQDLYARLWPDGTFVDFDQSLNVAIKKLRDSLSDSADEPHFIETVAGFGYRFIGQLECESEPVPQALVESPAEPRPVSLNARQWFNPKLLRATVSGVVFLGVVATLLAFSSRQPHYRSANFHQITHSGTEKTPFTMDGERIYFFESQGGETLFTQLSVNGGEALRMPAVASVLPYQADVLGDKLIYLDGSWSDYHEQDKGAHVWVRQLPAGTPWQVPDAGCQSVSWTREGDILCALGGEFSILDLQGRLVQKLFKVRNLAFWAHLSPDGKKVRFELPLASDLTRRQIWESDSDGSNLHALAPELGISCCGSWSKDGSLYIFQVWDGSRWDLWMLPETNGWLVRKRDPVRLTSGPLDARYPRISSDGQRVLFMGADYRGELSAVEEKTHRLVPYLGGESITEVDFSPDRNWITYIAYPEGTLWRSRLDGSDRLQLTRLPLVAYSPKFSRDGSQIFFSDLGGSGGFYAVSINGGELRPLFKRTIVCVSPGDTLLDFPFLTWCPNGAEKYELRLVDPGAGTSRKIPDADGMFNAVLSPDGQLIAGIVPHTANLEVFQMKTQHWTKIPIPLADNPGILSWSPSGDAVYVRQDEVILRCALRTRHAEVLIRIPKSSSYLWWGNRFSVSPDGKVLVTRQIGAGDIYAFELEVN